VLCEITATASCLHTRHLPRPPLYCFSFFYLRTTPIILLQFYELKTNFAFLEFAVGTFIYYIYIYISMRECACGLETTEVNLRECQGGR
jgi:hypothetical protein